MLTTHRGRRLRLLPLALAVIIFCTAVPVEFRGPVMWSNGFDIGDFVTNVLLYAPLGLALLEAIFACRPGGSGDTFDRH